MAPGAVNETECNQTLDAKERARKEREAFVLELCNFDITPPSSPEKPVPSSPLLPHEQKSVQASQHLRVTNPDPIPSPREIKKTIGPWNLGATLGEGATGRVRKARHIITGQVAAVKIMSKMEAAKMRSQSVMQMDSRIASRADQVHRNSLPFGLEREIVIMKLISHPNITKLYDLWENRGEIYLVLEYVEGGELFQLIVENGCLGERESMRIFRQLMSAVSYCHMFRVCHRDIKPENILLDRIGNVKLADFGMATREHIGGLYTSCGSPHYAPPEIACGEHYVGSQVDIWSCGVVLYVMITGTLPFGNDMPPHDLEGVLMEIIEADLELSPHVNPVANDLLKRMLHKDPSSRITADLIWRHPIVLCYDSVARVVSDPQRWIGGPPRPLTTKDCGVPLSRSEIDKDLLKGLCTLWHCVDSEEMLSKLTDDKPNYEKVIYNNLRKFREEQEDIYHGLDVEHADSDVHHISFKDAETSDQAESNRVSSKSLKESLRPTTRAIMFQSSLSRISNREDLLGAMKRPTPEGANEASLQSSGSNFTIASEPQRKGSLKYSIAPPHPQTSRRPSQKSQSTEKSYDPFRASSAGIPATAADHARITVLGNVSANSPYDYASYATSMRHPGGSRVTSEGSSAVNPIPRDNLGHLRSLRRYNVNREISSSSWASTRMSKSSSVRQFPVPSIRKKRAPQMPHGRRRSPPPARPRNPTPNRMRERYIQERRNDSKDSINPELLKVGKKRSQGAQNPKASLKRSGSVLASSINTTRALLEGTRQASVELSQLMDQVFSESNIESALWDEMTEEEKKEELTRTSSGQGSRRGSGNTQTLLGSRVAEVKERSKNTETVEELTRMVKILEQGAKALKTTSLDPIIEHMNRIIQEKSQSHRTASAPEASRNQDYNGTSMNAQNSARHASSPVKTTKGRYERSAFRGNKSTIRLVEEVDANLFPAPLNIKKKASAPLLSTPQIRNGDEGLQGTKSTGGRLRLGKSMSALNTLFKRDGNRSSFLTGPPGTPNSSSDYGSVAKTNSAESRVKNWFHRNVVYKHNSSHSGLVSESVDSSTGDEPLIIERTTAGNKTTVRLLKRESAASRVRRFFKGENKEKRMQIAMPSKKKVDGKELPTKTDLPNGNQEDRNASKTTITSDRSQRSETMTSQSVNPRVSQFARRSSPHLFNATKAHEPRVNSSTNLFARLFNIHVRQTAPTPQLFCLNLERMEAILQIRSILRDWRRYGLCHIRTSIQGGTVRATVSENNALNMLPVTIVATIHAVAVDGNVEDLSIVKVTAEWGNRKSFAKACDALNGVLRGRNLVVKERHIANEMKTALRDWENL